MSIFDIRTGERPIIAQQDAVPVHQELSPPVLTTPLVASGIGVRPVGECPGIVDWGGVVLSVATEVALPEPVTVIQAFSSEEVLAAIDAALRENSACVAVHGLFDLDA
jgi:hypothetical protein